MTSSKQSLVSAPDRHDIENRRPSLGAERIKTRESGPTGGQILDRIGFDPEPNIMSSLHQPTYYFRFYLLNDLYPDHKSGITIAETGVTGINIQDVKIDTIVGPNMRTRNTIATNATIKLFEPYGARLPDIMFWAAQELKVFNYLKAPWYLELRLRGYDDEGKMVEVPGGPWRWKLTILDIQTKIDETGSVHTINALPLAEVALENQYSKIPTAMSVEGDTVGDVLRNIIDEMNKDVLYRYGDQHIKYEIQDVEYPDESRIVERPFDHRIIADKPLYNDTRQFRNAQFAPGMDIPTILDVLIASSVTGVQQARLSRSIDVDSERDSKDIKSVVSLMHRVETQVENVGYNPILGDYDKVVRFIVRPYSTVRLFTSVDMALDFDKNLDLQRKKASYAIKNSFLSKQYDYIFTGNNTEVEKFDINVNFRWAVSVPLLKGRMHYGNSTVPPKLNEDANLIQSRQELANLRNDINQINGKYLNDVMPVETMVELNNLKLKQNLVLNDFQSRFAPIKQRTQQQMENAKRAQPLEPLIAEDELSGNLGEIKSHLPITIVQDGDDPTTQTNFGVSAQANEGRSIYGTLLNQLYGSFDGNLQDLTLDIKGDPYWLGWSNASGPSFESSTKQRPNFMNGDHMFVFRFKLPMGFDNESNSVNLASDQNDRAGNNNVVTGFYVARRVVHHFSGGIFKQTLEAVRIAGWNVENIIKDSENIS